MSEWQEDLINTEDAATLDGLLFERVHRSPHSCAYRYHDKAARAWCELSWEDVMVHVTRWRAALSGEQIEHGERVAIQLRNCPGWVFFDQAALGEGLVTVPLYTEDRPDNVAYVLADSACRLLLVQSVSQWHKLRTSLHDNKALRRVLVMDSPRDAAVKQRELDQDERLRFVDDWLPDSAPQPGRREGDPHALASIVYTSGTTGRPKGVMLSHYNMLSVAHAAVASVDCYQQDLFLSFLPLSHTLERTAGYYLPMMAGATVAYSRSVNQLAEDLLVIKPTVLIAVPRIFERVHARISAKLEKGSFIERWLFNSAVNIGYRDFARRQGRAGWRPQLLLNPILRRLVGNKVMAKLGGHMRYAISGGAALPFLVARTFAGLGLEILQGYGLTETSPVISVNRSGNNDLASVGEPLPGIEVRIAENDELVVKSPGIMLGYWNNDVATHEVIDPDGWLHTGDQACMERGCIRITGRLKDILVLSNGEKIPPVDMESAICMDPLIDQALVIGEGKSYLSALVVLDQEHWFGFVKEAGLDPFSRDTLDNEQLQKRVLARIRKQLHDFPGYAKIRRVALTLDAWTVDNGLLTPTLKARRPRIMEQYQAQIEALYD